MNAVQHLGLILLIIGLVWLAAIGLSHAAGAYVMHRFTEPPPPRRTDLQPADLRHTVGVRDDLADRAHFHRDAA